MLCIDWYACGIYWHGNGYKDNGVAYLVRIMERCTHGGV